MTREWFVDELIAGETAGYTHGIFDGTRRVALCAPQDAERIAAAHNLHVTRDEWVADGVVCAFCGGPAFAWLTTDETWAKVEPLLDQGQACAVCFLAAWQSLGLSTGEPFRLVEP